MGNYYYLTATTITVLLCGCAAADGDDQDGIESPAWKPAAVAVPVDEAPDMEDLGDDEAWGADEPVEEEVFEASPSRRRDEESIAKVIDGFSATKPGVILIINWEDGTFASGALINNEWALTAGHAFEESGCYPVTVWMGNDCIVGGPTGNCNAYPSVDTVCVDKYVDSDQWVPANDVALMRTLYYLGWGSPATGNSSYWLRWSADVPRVGDDYYVWGYGYDQPQGGVPEVSRRSNGEQNIDIAGWGTTFGTQTVAGRGGPCRGDSGGPALSYDLISSTNPVILGVDSYFTYVGNNDVCPLPGDSFYYTQVSGRSKIAWIERTVGSCNTYTSTRLGRTVRYKRCW